MQYLTLLLTHLSSILLFLILVAVVNLAPPVMIDVEIYASGDPEEYFYCASGSLAPPARYVSSGAVPEGQESYC